MTTIDGRRAAWSDVLHAELAGTQALWQDLDGLHVAPPPADPPPTSIMWAWSPDRLVRVRLDGAVAHVAVIPAVPGAPTVPWRPDDGRVAAFRAADGSSGLGDLRLEQVRVDGTDGDGMHGAVTFLRRVTTDGDRL